MSREYAEERIRKALEACRGNTVKTQQKIIAEAMQDHRLLLSLTQGHLTGIAALWINRVVTRQHDEDPAVPDAPEALNMTPASFGQEIMHAMKSDNTAMFGSEGYAPPMKRKKASQRHIDTLKMLSSSSKSKSNSSKSKKSPEK